MKRTLSVLAMALAALAAATTAVAQSASFQAGKHYTVLPQTQRTNVAPGKVEVMEVFSYGCPACDRFQPTIKKMKASLPANAQVVYLPASWNKAENWPTFQRAYITAQSLGVAERAHDEMYKAIWDTGELGVIDTATNRPKRALPTMEDIAKLYQRVAGVKPAEFVQASKSFGVDMKIRQAEDQILAMKVAGTPTLVVNGKYMVNNDSVSTPDEIIAIVRFLVAKETAAAKPASNPAPAAAPAKKS